MAAAIPYAQLAGAGMQAYSQAQYGRQAQDLGNLRAGVAGAQATSATQQGSEQEVLERQRLAQVTGAQEAQVGSSGIATSGSALKVMESTRLLASQDIMRTRMNAARTAWGFRVDQASDRYIGDSQKTSADQSAFATILGGGVGVWKTNKSLSKQAGTPTSTPDDNWSGWV
jgi:hypothetical protein